jgi:Icc-related predicted phosphoesterase
MARWICVSDTHNKRVPRFNGDVLLHAGDLTIRGTEKELIEAAEGLAGYPCRTIIVVPGNHDILFETNPAKARQIFEERKIKVLIDESTEAYGVKIYGSPWVQKCWGVFGYDGFEVKHPWDKIPNDTEILITHSPPRYIMDKGPRGDHLGCPDLAVAVRRVKPAYHIFGHIHCGQGFEQDADNIKYINAAICSERYDVLNPPIAFNFGLPGNYERW